jgi:tRNA(Arg) A34 adenosine deaminase TadA
MKVFDAHMVKAFELAELAKASGEYPFGAVLANGPAFLHGVTDAAISTGDPTQHAEIRVLSQYCRLSKRSRLDGLTIYCSVEPCVMCSGAIHWAHISRVVFSVTQSYLQMLTGGVPKPRCESFINIGGRHVDIIGPCHEVEGTRILDGFDFTLKARLSRT